MNVLELNLLFQHKVSTVERMEKKNWYIIHIKPAKEQVVKAQLSRIGIETFYPKIRVKKGKTEKVEPMFPLYMFAKFSLEKDFINVNYTRGVRRVVRFGENVPSVSEELIQSLKKISGGKLVKEETFKVGETVEILEGPFRGFIGEVLKAKSGGERVVVLLKAAKICPTAEVPASILKRIS